MGGFVRVVKPKNEYEEKELRYNSTRTNLLLIAVFTLINVILVAVGSNTRFLFSATIPYFLIDVAKYLCGMYPPEFYGEEFSSLYFFPKGVYVVAVIVALIIIAIYVACFFLSNKKRVGWMIFSLVFFCVDTLILVFCYGFAIELLLDYAFHIGIIISLSMGVSFGFYLKNNVKPVISTDGNNFQSAGCVSNGDANTVILRVADFSVKHKVLLSADVEGRSIVYRRVKSVNELVVDGNVYAEYKAVLEFPHTLTVNIDGKLISAGYDGINSFIDIDGNRIAKKVRLI